MSSECPECMRPLRPSATSCRSCGWGTSENATVVADQQRFRCAWQANGDRCRYFGTISGDTKGAGPWYCREHYGCAGQIEGASILERSRHEVSSGQRYDAASCIAVSKAAYLLRVARAAEVAERAAIQAEGA